MPKPHPSPRRPRDTVKITEKADSPSDAKIATSEIALTPDQVAALQEALTDVQIAAGAVSLAQKDHQRAQLAAQRALRMIGVKPENYVRLLRTGVEVKADPPADQPAPPTP